MNRSAPWTLSLAPRCRTKSPGSGEETQKTVVLITNDPDEGIYLADRIIPLTAGPRATLGPSIRDRNSSPPRPQGDQSRSAISNSCAAR